MRKIGKGLNALVVLLMFLQPVSAPSILRAMAAEGDAVSAPAPDPAPAPKEEPKTESTAPVAPKETPAPAPDPTPAPKEDPKVEPAPAVEASAPAETPAPTDTVPADTTPAPTTNLAPDGQTVPVSRSLQTVLSPPKRLPRKLRLRHLKKMAISTLSWPKKPKPVPLI